jgi:hypothetical protein
MAGEFSETCDQTGRNNGAGDRIRTGDIDLGKVALYQLSYSRPYRKTPFSNGNNTDVKRYGYVTQMKAFINL